MRMKGRLFLICFKVESDFHIKVGTAERKKKRTPVSDTLKSFGGKKNCIFKRIEAPQETIGYQKKNDP